MQFFNLNALEPVSELALAVGTPVDVPAIRDWLAKLPAHAYGQVLIESDESVEPLDAPQGVMVHRVPVGLEPGEGLSRAVTAWFDEWLWVDSEVDRSVQMWTGNDLDPSMRDCWDRFDRRIARRHFARGITEAQPHGA